VSLSTSYFDHKFHVIKAVDILVEVVESTIGCNGLLPVQNLARHVGSVSSIGEQSRQSQALPSPSKGPGKYGHFFYQNYINNLFGHLFVFIQSFRECIVKFSLIYVQIYGSDIMSK